MNNKLIKKPKNKEFFCRTCKKEVIDWITVPVVTPPPPTKVLGPDGKAPGIGIMNLEFCPRCGACKLPQRTVDGIMKEMQKAEA